MKKILFFTICFIFITASLQSRTIKKEQKFTDTAGKSYLIIIAIDKYQNRLPLDRCIKEANDFRNILFANYNFDEMIELYNKDASFNNVAEIFKRLQKTSNENDSILIYFNGHGYIDPLTKEGYWILHDSGINEQLKEKWLSNTEFINVINKIKAKHLALICESCFSQNLMTEEGKKIPKEDEEYFRISFEKKSALALLSGKTETGPEESEMTREIVKSLKFSKKSWIDLLILYNDIKFKVRGSIVFFGHFNSMGHEIDGGHVLFLRDDIIDMKEYEANKNESKIAENKDKEKIIEKEKIIKKEKTITFQSTPDNLKNLNITSLTLLISGSTFTSIGLGLFIFDMIVMFKDVRELINENNDYYNGNYIRYDQLYTLNLIFFCTGISVAGTGALMMAAALALRIYTVVKKKQLSFDINFKDKIEIAASIRF